MTTISSFQRLLAPALLWMCRIFIVTYSGFRDAAIAYFGGMLAGWLVLLLICSIATAYLFRQKRYDTSSGVLVGFLLGTLGVLLAVGLPMGGVPCLRCGEKCARGAEVCPWCGNEYPSQALKPRPAAPG